MKFSDLTIDTFNNVEDKDAYIICNVVDHVEDDVNKVSKSLLHISNFAHKEAINSIVEQNKKFVTLVSTLLNKCNELEGQLNSLKTDVNKLNIKSQIPNGDMDEINNKIAELQNRLDNNLIEDY